MGWGLSKEKKEAMQEENELDELDDLEDLGLFHTSSLREREDPPLPIVST